MLAINRGGIGLSLGTFVTFAMLVSLVSAQQPSAQQSSATAEALFRAGRQASARGDHASACANYRESYRIENALGTLLNIAVCEEAVGQLASAWQHYQHVLYALAPNDARVALTRARLAELERRLPRLSVVISQADRSSTRILLGEVELSPSSLDVPLPLDPGRHELRVYALGYEPSSYSFEIAEGEQRTLDVTPGAPIPSNGLEPKHSVRRPITLASAAPAPSDRVEPGAMQRTIGVTALVLGGAGLLTSAVSFGLAIERKLVVDDHCPRDVCDAKGEAAARSGRDFVHVSLASLAVGVVGSATGLYLFWTAPEGGTASIAAGPWLTDNVVGAHLRGSL
jgi:hypothetical protein